MSSTKSNSGYYRVSKTKCKGCKQGFKYIYQYYAKNNKRKSISSVDIKKLEKKVKKEGLDWFKF